MGESTTRLFTFPGTHRDLPELSPGDKAVIALVHPVVTEEKTCLRNKKLKQESISLLSDPKTANLPLENVVNAFKNGFDSAGMLECHQPDLTMLMTNYQLYQFRLESRMSASWWMKTPYRSTRILV